MSPTKPKRCLISPALSLPFDVVTLATAIVGVRGSGKTNTGVVIAEDVLASGHQVIVIDPLDVWWGLKSSADGKSPGYPITVIGGPHGEIPLLKGDGRAIADFLVEHRAPAILSLRHLRKGEQRHLVTEFAEQLFHRKGEDGHKTPVLCVLDEASQFIPQRVMGEDARLVGAIQDWVRLGRSSGIGAMLIDQRPASVNKDVLTQIELMVTHRITSPQDRKALQAWIEANASAEQERDYLASLASLARGEAWFWSPEWLKVFDRVVVRARRTFDSSATPVGGKSVAAPKIVAQADLDALKAKLAATIERARADDPVELRKQLAARDKRIGELERAAAAAPKAESVREVPVIPPATLADLEKVIRATGDWSKMLLDVDGLLERKLSAVRALRDELRIASNEIGKLVNRVTSPPAASPRPGLTGGRPVGSSPAARIVERKPASGADDSAAGTLNAAQRKIVAALAWWHSISVASPTRPQVAFVARLNPAGGYFSRSFSALVSGGMVEAAAGGVRMTEAGHAAAPVVEERPTLADYHAGIREVLATSAQRSIFDAIVAVGGAEISVAAIGEGVGMDVGGGYFNRSLSPLGTLGLIERRDRHVFPTELLFPGGLR